MQNKNILVVDDEPDLLDLLREILEMHGHTVFGAGSRTEALAEWEKNSSLIELLVTDISLPQQITGLMLAGELQARKPELKVLYTSGHDRVIVAEKYGLPEDATFLKKPFSPDALAKAVQSL